MCFVKKCYFWGFVNVMIFYIDELIFDYVNLVDFVLIFYLIEFFDDFECWECIFIDLFGYFFFEIDCYDFWFVWSFLRWDGYFEVDVIDIVYIEGFEFFCFVIDVKIVFIVVVGFGCGCFDGNIFGFVVCD